jgi:hypothetical protein
MATTFEAIRDSWVTDIQALTPTFLPDRLFRVVPTRYSMQEWSSRGSSDLLREFSILRGKTVDAGVLAAETIERNESVLVTVAYPFLPALYGSLDSDDMEKAMRSDARQIRDVLTSSGNYQGEQWNAVVRILRAVTEGSVWFQPMEVNITYWETR